MRFKPIFREDPDGCTEPTRGSPKSIIIILLFSWSNIQNGFSILPGVSLVIFIGGYKFIV